MNDFLRSLLYPGLDLHTRNRASLAQLWRRGPRDVLDAGCGNGYFAWLAYRSGANVTAVSNDQAQVRKAEAFLIGYRGADPARLRFQAGNLYDIAREPAGRYDEVICYEVLEHLVRDREMLEIFQAVLRPGGVLHLCCPNRLHPRHRREVLDTQESGGHVRPGYTEEEFRALLEPLGYAVRRVVGIGPRSLYLADAAIRWIRERAGDAVALPLFLLLLPTVWLARFNPPEPFSLCVVAEKKEAR
jgi:SAM-dependent methyltransferase